jgi:hypothetical protein
MSARLFRFRPHDLRVEAVEPVRHSDVLSSNASVQNLDLESI